MSTTLGMERRNRPSTGPQPTLYGKAAATKREPTCSPSWAGLTPDEFNEWLRERNKQPWGTFASIPSPAFAPDYFPEPRKKQPVSL